MAGLAARPTGAGGVTSYTRAMRADDNLHIEWVENEAVALDPATGHVHYLNPPAAVVYAMIQEYGFDDAMKRIEEEYEPDSGIRTGLDGLLADMVAKGLLHED